VASRIGALQDFRAAQTNLDAARTDALKLGGANDTNYIFLSFVTHYLPVGVVGLVVAVIFTAAMSAISGEINSLATVTVIDIYKRHIAKNSSDKHYLGASRIATAFWGIYAIAFASTTTGFGSLIEAVNQVGSLFYGGMLGVFVLAFFVKRCTATGAFVGVLAGEAAIFTTARFTAAFLWYNVVGCLVVVAVGWTISLLQLRNK
jgi:Na+/proline symporter